MAFRDVPDKKSRKNIVQIISVIGGTLGGVSNGMHFGYSWHFLPTSTRCLSHNDHINVSINDAAPCNSTAINNVSNQMLFRTFYLLGAMVGLFLYIPLTKVNARRIIIPMAIISLISWILLAVAKIVMLLFLARILAGITIVWTVMTSPIYVSQILDEKRSKSYDSLVYFGILSGIFIINVIGTTSPPIIPPIIATLLLLAQLVLSIFMVDSPYFLISNNRIDEARETLQKLKNVESVEKDLEEMKIRILKMKREERHQNLFNSPSRKRSCIIIIVINLSQQFSGVTVFIMFMFELLSESDVSLVLIKAICPVFIAVVTVGSLLSKIIPNEIHSISRYTYPILTSSTLVSLAVYCTLKNSSQDMSKLSWWPVVTILIYGTVLGLNERYFPHNLVEKLYPDVKKQFGLIFLVFTKILFAWLTVELFQRFKEQNIIDIPLYIFAGVSLLGSFISYSLMPPSEVGNVRSDGVVGDGNEGVELIGNRRITALKGGSNTNVMTVITGSENIFKGTFPQLVAVLAGTLTAISDGMQYGWTSPVLPILLGPESPVKVTKDQAEWLENLLMLGSFSGLSITMYLVDKIGRKKSILLASFVTVCIWLVTALAPRVEYILVARAFAGSAGNMAFVATPMYIAEIAEQKIRGFLSSLIYLMMLVGIFLIYAVAPYIPFYAHCIIGGGLALTELLVFPFMPESPYYLLYKNNPDDAYKSLKRLRSPGVNVDKEFEEIKAAVARQREERGKIHDLVVIPSNRKAMIIMAILNGAQHFSSISVLLMNLHNILEAAGSIYIEPATAAILFALLMVIAASIASVTIDKFGRRTLLISSSLATGICLMVLAVYFSLKNAGYDTAGVSWIPVACVMCYALVFKCGLGMVPIVLTAELFPAKVKAFGMTLADGMYVIAALLSLQVYQRLYDNYGMEYPFYVFAVSCYVAAIFTYLFIPETKGKTLEDIQMILKGRYIDDKSKLNSII